MRKAITHWITEEDAKKYDDIMRLNKDEFEKIYGEREQCYMFSNRIADDTYLGLQLIPQEDKTLPYVIQGFVEKNMEIIYKNDRTNADILVFDPENDCTIFMGAEVEYNGETYHFGFEVL